MRLCADYTYGLHTVSKNQACSSSSDIMYVYVHIWYIWIYMWIYTADVKDSGSKYIIQNAIITVLYTSGL